jgi:hypothetical protein
LVDKRAADELGRHWEDGWNKADLSTIMAPFARDVIFSSPFVSRMTGDPAKTTIEGFDALRSYVSDALGRSSGVRYTLDATYTGTNTVILAYTCHAPTGGSIGGADIMRVDADGKVVEWRCHYAFRPEEVAT